MDDGGRSISPELLADGGVLRGLAAAMAGVAATVSMVLGRCLRFSPRRGGPPPRSSSASRGPVRRKIFAGLDYYEVAAALEELDRMERRRGSRVRAWGTDV